MLDLGKRPGQNRRTRMRTPLLALAAALSCGPGRRVEHANGGERPDAGTVVHAEPDAGAGAPNDLWVAPGSRDFSQNPALLRRILATPHGYFRFINPTFSSAICVRFADELAELPTVNLHGDAHLEQYAVTDLGRGLTDFDDSANGPPVLDLMRITTSMRIAAHQLRIADHGDALVAAFFAGYKAALADPEAVAPDPPWASRERAAFRHDRPRYLVWAESLMQPVDDATRAELSSGVRPYIESMQALHPELPPDFFRVESIGRLQMGIGSALDEKYLVRVRGLTPTPLDDVILEAKELRDLSGISCMSGERRRDPFRILLGQSRIAYVPYPYLGYIRFRARVFWVHGWVDNYAELDLGTVAPADLADVANDIGVQLGRGHPKQIASPLDLQLRRALAEMLDRLHGRIETMSVEMAANAIASWERFRREAPALPPELAEDP